MGAQRSAPSDAECPVPGSSDGPTYGRVVSLAAVQPRPSSRLTDDPEEATASHRNLRRRRIPSAAKSRSERLKECLPRCRAEQHVPQLRPQERATGPLSFWPRRSGGRSMSKTRLPDLREYALEVRLRVDREIEQRGRLAHKPRDYATDAALRPQPMGPIIGRHSATSRSAPRPWRRNSMPAIRRNSLPGPSASFVRLRAGRVAALATGGGAQVDKVDRFLRHDVIEAYEELRENRDLPVSILPR